VVNKREGARERGGQDGSSALVVSTLNDGQASAATTTCAEFECKRGSSGEARGKVHFREGKATARLHQCTLMRCS
jgi:hypothetical protein